MHVCLISQSGLNSCWLKVGSSCFWVHSGYPSNLKLHTNFTSFLFMRWEGCSLKILTSVLDMIHQLRFLFPFPSLCEPQFCFSVITWTEFPKSFSICLSMTSKSRDVVTFSTLVHFCPSFSAVDMGRKHWLLLADSGQLLFFSFRTIRKLKPGR